MEWWKSGRQHSNVRRFPLFHYSIIPATRSGNVISLTVYVSLLLCLASCANQVAPSGGPRDVTPPKVLKSVPENQSTRFTGREIVITFDEYIQLKDLSKQLIISPPFKRTPEVTIKKKSLVITFDDTLKDNTTYTINFGDAIVDNNEGNPITAFQYVFSTGDVIDSLAVQGKVMNAFDRKKEKGILVMLYKINEDSIPYKERPDFFTRTLDSGQFKITNVAPGDYKIFALKESNNNYLFDSRDENIAFSDQRITAGETKNVELLLFREKEKQHVVKAYSESPGKAGIIFNLPVDSLIITPANDSSRIALVEYSEKRDTVTMWYENRELDSLNLYISAAGMPMDTVTIRLFKSSSKTLRGRGELSAPAAFAGNVLDGGIVELDQPFILLVSQPLKNLDFSMVSLMEDSLPLKDFKIQFLDSAKRKLSISKTLPGGRQEWKENAVYKLFIPSDAFAPLFDQKADTVQFNFKTKSLADYGTLALKVIVPKPNTPYILQMLDGNENVYRQVGLTNDTTFHFEHLIPRSYKLKLIEDTNNNGMWDTGNYLLHIQPETVLYYRDDINVRANWDVEAAWNTK